MVTGEACNTCGHSDEDHSDGHCHWRQHGAVLACRCTKFVSPTAEVIAALPPKERNLLAAANFLGGLNPSLISDVKIIRDGGGHDEAVEITIRIHTGRQASQWLQDYRPKQMVEWVTRYLQKRKAP